MPVFICTSLFILIFVLFSISFCAPEITMAQT